MNILIKYIKEADAAATSYSEILAELFTYSIMGKDNPNASEETRLRFEKDYKKYKNEIVELLIKGKRA